MARAIALVSGSLDSRLAVRMVQRQGVEVRALLGSWPCCSTHALAERAAGELNVPLTVLAPSDEFVAAVRAPVHGYGRGANPCLDCRVLLLRAAAAEVAGDGADFVVTGEVLGQHRQTQRHRDLALLAHASGLGDRLVRPLSARQLAPTAPERRGLLDRARLGGLVGASRTGQIALARELGLDAAEPVSPGCALAEPALAARVHEWLAREPSVTLWDLELLKLGRQEWFDEQTRIVLGRRADENVLLEHLAIRSDARPCEVVRPANFVGPTALVVGRVSEAACAACRERVLARSRAPLPECPRWS